MRIHFRRLRLGRVRLSFVSLECVGDAIPRLLDDSFGLGGLAAVVAALGVVAVVVGAFKT